MKLTRNSGNSTLSQQWLLLSFTKPVMARLNAVRYEKSENGYNLHIENGWIGEPELAFPEAFRIGLGIKQTNVVWSNESHSQDELKKEIRL